MRPALPQGPYLIVGLARSGQAAARVLADRGERVMGVDSGRPHGADDLAGAGVDLSLESDGLAELAAASSVIKSPGVPTTAPAIAAARDRGIPVIGELELAWRLLSNRFVAVTGTNGKTTVAELLGHVWRTAGEPVRVAGNVGTPLASLVGQVEPAATIVCEASSFQLEDSIAFAPECGLLLNVAPDHLDRHRTLDDYLAAKLRVFANQGPEDFAVINGADPIVSSAAIPGAAQQIDFSERIGRDRTSLIGPHTAANAAAAAAAAEAMGIGAEAIRHGLATFPGIPHRLERTRELDGVTYVNDSKATNVAAASAALRSFDGGVRAILGGSLKGGGFDELATPVAERCVACYLIGEAAERLEEDLAPAWSTGVERRRCAGLAEAVTAAAAGAAPGEIVLLAPACASFDAYSDFEQRGEHFRELVESLGA
ncbi:MAG: UDP-N-acetylmuramoyl-L-alanine--D-glutamate ligase [Solirubrobacterales bacterium]